MNRRDLLKFMGVGGAGLLIPSTTTYFFAPRGGWVQRLRIRYVEQYTINADLLPIRYDATWDTANGPEQYHIYGPPMPVYTRYGDFHQEARQILEKLCVTRGGSPNSSYVRLPLPQAIKYAGYVP